MCGRYTVLTEDEIVEMREMLKELSVRIMQDADKPPKSEISPGDLAPIITIKSETTDFKNAKWGFKKINSSSVIINARCETINTKSIFSKHITRGRCVVPAHEFFEWKREGGAKQKHYVKDKEGNILFMAGLYREVAKADGIPLREFVIITKEATGELAKIHDRAPLLLRVEQVEGWLTGTLSTEAAAQFEYELAVHPVKIKRDEAQISFL